MSKFLRLSEINRDIDLLESYGDFKSASILHKKFVKEAQKLKNMRDSDPYNKVFDKYIEKADTNPSADLIEAVKSNGFLYKEDQDLLASYISNKLNPVKGNKPVVKKPAEVGLTQPKAKNRKPESSDAKINYEYTGTNTNFESNLSPTLAPIVKMQNQRLEPLTQPVAPSNEKSNTETKKVETPKDKTPKVETPKVEIKNTSSALLDKIVRNFWDNRYPPGKNNDEIYEELKKDIVMANSVRYHIRGSNHPEKNEILKLFNEKMNKKSP